jgi:hypothetical protein
MNNYFNTLRKVNESRVHKITNSYGIHEYYRYYKKGNLNAVSYNQYSKILHAINEAILKELIEQTFFILPLNLGKLEIRKRQVTLKEIDGKLINTMLVDWKQTLHLWETDEECAKKKKVVRIPNKEVFFLHYNRVKAKYKNKSFYTFHPNRNLKIKLKEKIIEGNYDAFLIRKYDG